MGLIRGWPIDGTADDFVVYRLQPVTFRFHLWEPNPDDPSGPKILVPFTNLGSSFQAQARTRIGSTDAVSFAVSTAAYEDVADAELLCTLTGDQTGALAGGATSYGCDVFAVGGGETPLPIVKWAFVTDGAWTALT